MKKIIITFIAVVLTFPSICYGEQRTLSLEDCRNLAIESNKELRSAQMKQKTAHYERKAAFTNYLPKISASGTYMRMEKEVSLLSDEQKHSLSHLGDALPIPGVPLNTIGEALVDGLHTDTRNMTAATIMLTQPIFMGGKIRAYNRITRYAEQIAAQQYDLQLQNTIVEVDEAYWKIVALVAKKKLAEGYLNLIETLDRDVTLLIEEGVATKADGLSVKVKLNEAKVTLIQVDNGLDIMKMLLCQLCGLDMNTEITLADENTNPEYSISLTENNLTALAFTNRPELQLLSNSVKIYDEKVKLARANYLPHIALTGGYLVSNPSVFNGFENKFNGTWNIGVAVSIPILTWGERSYKVKAAKNEALRANIELDEVREKIELQVNQCQQKVQEANERYLASRSSMEEAEENLRYATLGLQEGVIPVSNVIEAQTAWLSAHSEYITSAIDIHLANLYLNKSLGIIK